MTSSVTRLERTRSEPAMPPQLVPVVRCVTSVSADGAICIDGDAPEANAVPARALANLAADLRVGSAVLIVFENADPALPIAIGVLDGPPANSQAPLKLSAARQLAACWVVDGNTMLLDAQREIVLRCGKSSITLRSDGKIVLRGREVLSRASEANRLKGSTVSIN